MRCGLFGWLWRLDCLYGYLLLLRFKLPALFLSQYSHSWIYYISGLTFGTALYLLDRAYGVTTLWF